MNFIEMRETSRKPSRLGFFVDLSLILLFSLALLSSLFFSQNWPLSHDGLRFLCHLDQFKDAFDAGILYPRWLPNYYGGYGYPVFVFYQPGYFYFSLPFALLGMDILSASYASGLAMFFLGGAGAYFLVFRLSGGHRTASLFSSAIFLITPYLFVNLYVRGDLSELLAMFIAPWSLLFLIRLKDSAEAGSLLMPGVILNGLLLAGLVYSHPFVSLFFYPVYVFFAVALACELRKRDILRFGAAVMLALFSGAMLSMPYWLPAYQMKEHVDYMRALADDSLKLNHCVYPMQLFSRSWGFGGSEGGSADGMSFQLGLPHFILALFGFWMGRKILFARGAFIAYAICLIAMLPTFDWFWKNIPLLNIVQFPWRLLSVVATLQIICISGIYKLHYFNLPGWKRMIAPLALLTATILWNWDQFEFRPFKFKMREVIAYHRILRLEKMEVYESFNEFLPKTASRYQPVRARGKDPLLCPEDPNSRIFEFPGSDAHRLCLKISSPKAQTAIFNQLYFPGWKISLSGIRIDEKELQGNLSPDGRMNVRLPPGEDIIFEAVYDGPPGWYGRNIVIGVFAVVILTLLLSEKNDRIWCISQKLSILSHEDTERAK